MRSFKTEGIIIKRRNVGEANRILTVFSKHLGKIQIKASGVRKISSKRSSHIELLNDAALTLYKGPKFMVLTEAQVLQSFSEIKQDLEKVGFAYHICELVDGLCAEEEENSKVFFLLQKTLEKLNTTDDIVSIIHEFEIELLTQLGFWHKTSAQSKFVNIEAFIENILERKLKSRKIFTKLNFDN